MSEGAFTPTCSEDIGSEDLVVEVSGDRPNTSSMIEERSEDDLTLPGRRRSSRAWAI
jgi:hypothetical protein